jgi:anaerobic magnesium-protoporphyrin IX monomethyl ester cyclase
LDCTFLNRREALRIAKMKRAEVVGIYCMVTMLEDCLWFARHLRSSCGLMVAGGPLPTCDSIPFLEQFDIVVRGEGEQTMVELLGAYEQDSALSSVPGIGYRKEAYSQEKGELGYTLTEERPFNKDLDGIQFPARELLPNQRYIQHGKRKYGYSITTVMSTRGCPYRCEFCSNVVFGGSYRERSPENVVDEIEEILELGYERVSFADDVFTLNSRRVIGVCEEIRRRGLRFSWECLGRVDAIDYRTALEMKKAGCYRIFFGIESGDEQVLKLMKKKITTEQARDAVEIAHKAGLQVGAFFILFYPGETNETVLNTLRFATSLPLDYLGLTMPFILPGTALNARVKDRVSRDVGIEYGLFVNNAPIYDVEFSKTKMWFAIFKGKAQFKMKKRLGRSASLFLRLFEKPTDELIKLLR